VRKADNLPPSCAVVTKFGSLNFMEPSVPVQVCNGTPLPLQGNMKIWTGQKQAFSKLTLLLAPSRTQSLLMMSLSEFRCILKECMSYFYNMALSLIFWIKYVHTDYTEPFCFHLHANLILIGLMRSSLWYLIISSLTARYHFPPKDRTCLSLHQTHTRRTNQ
jgi:hypothetical protein